LGFSFTVSAQENLIPDWIKNTAGWWSEGVVSDSDFVNSIQWLLDNKVLQVSNTEDDEWKSVADNLYKENQQLKAEIKALTETTDDYYLESEYDKLYKENQQLKAEIKALTENTELTGYDDARLAHINASYDKDTDRLRVTIFLTDSNGDYTKVNGNAELTVLQDGRTVYSDKYNFVKNDFVSWQSLMGGGKITGYLIDIRQFFPSGESMIMEYEVYVDLNTKTSHWELYDKFWSINESS